MVRTNGFRSCAFSFAALLLCSPGAASAEFFAVENSMPGAERDDVPAGDPVKSLAGTVGDTCQVAADAGSLFGFLPLRSAGDVKVVVSPDAGATLTAGQLRTLGALIMNLKDPFERLPLRAPENALSIKIEVLRAYGLGEANWTTDQWKDYIRENQVTVWYTEGTLQTSCGPIKAMNLVSVTMTPAGSSTLVLFELKWKGGFDEDGLPAWQLTVSGFVSRRIVETAEPRIDLGLPYWD